MRLSGNYFERLLINVIPWTLLASTIIHLTKKDINGAIVVFLISTAAFWLLDTLIIYFKFKNPKTLRLDKTLVWGNRQLSAEDIFRITPITDRRYRWSFDMIEFNLNDGTMFYVIDKPKSFIAEVLGRPSKTIKLLMDQYPQLDDKIKGRKFI